MTPASAQAPEGYEVVRELGMGRYGRAVECRKAGSTVVVRVLGVAGSAAAALAAELRTLAAAADHACAVGLTRVWIDPLLGVCIEQTNVPPSALDALPGADAPSAIAAGGVRLAAALAYSHRLGVLHGDVCPANVLLDAEGRWFLANGGVAQARKRAGAVPIDSDTAFAPRELQGWEQPAAPADVYSLGATLSARLLGSNDPAIFVVALASESSGLGALLIRMLAPNPADRPSLVEVDEVLRTVVSPGDREQLPAALPSPRESPAPPRPTVRLVVTEPDAIVRSGRRRTVVAAAAITAVFLASAAAVAVGNGRDESPAQSVSAGGTLPDPPTEPSGAPAAAPVSLRPYGLTLEAKVSPEKAIVLYVEWLIAAVPAELRSWRVVGAPRSGAGEEKVQPAEPVVRPDPDMTAPFRYGYFLSPNVPLSWCVRVESVLAGTSIPADRACLSAEAVRKGVAAAKTLAAQQQKSPSPKPGKPVRKA
ncbi:MAG: protein kinase domain-containing protein [Sporichthyaceae bacterium]